MIQTEQWCFEIENSQLCQTEHVGKMYAYIQSCTCIALSHYIQYNKHHARIQKMFPGSGSENFFELGGGVSEAFFW